MVEQNSVSDHVKNGAEQTRVDAQEFGREVYKMADTVRRDVVKQLYDVAETIRTQARDVGGEARESADRVARNLEQTANKLNSRAVDQMEETTQTMRENVWETAIIVLIIGVVIGLFLGNRK